MRLPFFQESNLWLSHKRGSQGPCNAESLHKSAVLAHSAWASDQESCKYHKQLYRLGSRMHSTNQDQPPLCVFQQLPFIKEPFQRNRVTESLVLQHWDTALSSGSQVHSQRWTSYLTPLLGRGTLQSSCLDPGTSASAPHLDRFPQGPPGCGSSGCMDDMAVKQGTPAQPKNLCNH